MFVLEKYLDSNFSGDEAIVIWSSKNILSAAFITAITMVLFGKQFFEETRSSWGVRSCCHRATCEKIWTVEQKSKISLGPLHRPAATVVQALQGLQRSSGTLEVRTSGL